MAGIKRWLIGGSTVGTRMKNKKALGQHWLKNRAILDEIADLAVVPGIQICLEIGPGLGTLTSSLLGRFKKVIAVEYDAELARKLPGQFPGKDLEIVNADILDYEIGLSDYVVAGNIPYYITSSIVKKTLELEHKPARIVLLMQKEVAKRIAAAEGKYSLLGLYAENLAEVDLGPVVLAREFTPPPKVHSQVLILDPRKEPIIDPRDLKLAKIGFSAPRKKLIANLAAGTGQNRDFWKQQLVKNGINPDARAEDLGLLDWENLAKIWYN